MALVALIVSILALGISSVLAWQQVKTTRVAANAQARVAEIEEARHMADLHEREQATLSAYFEPASATSHMLVVENTSRTATAYAVTIGLETRTAAGRVPDLLDSPFPTTIHPEARTTALVSEDNTTATQLRGTLKWRDDAGRGHERQQDLWIG